MCGLYRPGTKHERAKNEQAQRELPEHVQDISSFCHPLHGEFGGFHVESEGKPGKLGGVIESGRSPDPVTVNVQLIG